QNLDFSLQEHVDICDDVPTGEDDEYDWEDPDVRVCHVRGGLADNFAFDFDDWVEFD
ncbi:hypothetical protein MKW92_025625, partial [Papaver armeniacum]